MNKRERNRFQYDLCQVTCATLKQELQSHGFKVRQQREAKAFTNRGPAHLLVSKGWLIAGEIPIWLGHDGGVEFGQEPKDYCVMTNGNDICVNLCDPDWCETFIKELQSMVSGINWKKRWDMASIAGSWLILLALVAASVTGVWWGEVWGLGVLAFWSIVVAIAVTITK